MTRLCDVCHHVTWQSPDPDGRVLCPRCRRTTTTNQES